MTDPNKATGVARILWNKIVDIHSVVSDLFLLFCEINCTPTWMGKNKEVQGKCASSACKDDYKEINKSEFSSQIYLAVS